MFIRIYLVVFLAGSAISGTAQQKRFSFTEPKMGSPFTIVLYSNDSLQATYLAKQSFKLVDSFLSAFDFLIIDYIRLIWCEKLKNDNLQLSNRGDTFEDWKESVLKGNYEFENSFGGDYEDPTNIYYNYLLDAEGKDMSLYKYNQTDGTLIFLWYNPKTDTTMYSIDIELRKALFSIDKYFDVHLPDDFIEHNKIMLAQAEDKIMSMFKTI